MADQHTALPARLQNCSQGTATPKLERHDNRGRRLCFPAAVNGLGARRQALGRAQVPDQKTQEEGQKG